MFHTLHLPNASVMSRTPRRIKGAAGGAAQAVGGERVEASEAVGLGIWVLHCEEGGRQTWSYEAASRQQYEDQQRLFANYHRDRNPNTQDLLFRTAQLAKAPSTLPAIDAREAARVAVSHFPDNDLAQQV
jgi:hypothetical protein